MYEENIKKHDWFKLYEKILYHPECTNGDYKYIVDKR